MELKVNNYQLPEAISFNFEELKTGIQAKTEQYTKLVYTEDNIKTAKEDRADLNRLKKALNDERIRRQKDYMKPFDAFKKQIDEIIAIIDKPVLSIDAQIKEYEQIKQDEKRAAIEESLLKTKEDIIRNCQTLAGLPTYSHEAVIYYQRTLDVTGALAKVRELTEIEEAKKKMLQKTAEEAQAAKEYQEAIMRATPEPEAPRMWVGFQVYINSNEGTALKRFLENNGIKFKPINMQEEK